MRIIVCEDEKPALDRLIRLINISLENVEIIATCETGEDAIKSISELKPDLIFLDIELADGPCFHAFNEKNIDLPVIFTTAYEDYALKAFKLNCVDYLLKPVSKEAVNQALYKYKSMKQAFNIANGVNTFVQKEVLLKDQNNSFTKRLAVKTNTVIKFIKAEDVLWIESDGNYVEINTNTNKYLQRSTLKGILQILDSKSFYRIHKSILVNIEHIDFLEESGVGDFFVTMINGAKLRMSRNYKEILEVI